MNDLKLYVSKAEKEIEDGNIRMAEEYLDEAREIFEEMKEKPTKEFKELERKVYGAEFEELEERIKFNTEKYQKEMKESEEPFYVELVSDLERMEEISEKAGKQIPPRFYKIYEIASEELLKIPFNKLKIEGLEGISNVPVDLYELGEKWQKKYEEKRKEYSWI